MVLFISDCSERLILPNGRVIALRPITQIMILPNVKGATGILCPFIQRKKGASTMDTTKKGRSLERSFEI